VRWANRKRESKEKGYPMIHSASGCRADGPRLHRYVRISPRLATRAEGEISTGIGINLSIPEDAAAFLSA
jgi:hypothetical protein